MRTNPSARTHVAQNPGCLICSPASSSGNLSSQISISSVSTPSRRFTCSKTNFATFLLARPFRTVPRMTGMKSGRLLIAFSLHQLHHMTIRICRQKTFAETKTLVVERHDPRRNEPRVAGEQPLPKHETEGDE